MKNPNRDPARHAEIPVRNAESWMYEAVVIARRIRPIQRTGYEVFKNRGKPLLCCKRHPTAEHRTPAACVVQTARA